MGCLACLIRRYCCGTTNRAQNLTVPCCDQHTPNRAHVTCETYNLCVLWTCSTITWALLWVVISIEQRHTTQFLLVVKPCSYLSAGCGRPDMLGSGMLGRGPCASHKVRLLIPRDTSFKRSGGSELPQV